MSRAVKLGTESLGALHQLIDKAFPRYRNRAGGLDVRRLAKELKLSRQAVYYWFTRESISPDNANRIVKLSCGRVKIEDIQAFTFTDNA